MPFNRSAKDRRLSRSRVAAALLIVGFALELGAQPAAPSVRRSRPGPRAEWSIAAELIGVGGVLTPASSTINPGNRTLATPSNEAFLDARADLRWSLGTFKAVGRPRWTGTWTRVQQDSLTAGGASQETTNSEGKLDLTDLFVQWQALPSLQGTVGLFVDGWGPAEFVNPSNPFFHLTGKSKSFFFKEKGHALTKVLWTPSMNTAVSLLAEPVSNNEPMFRQDQSFSPLWAARGEWQSDSGAILIGGILGQEADAANFVGEYLQLRSDSTGFSVYGEARHTVDAKKFALVNTGGFEQLIEQRRGSSTLDTYSVLGVRWEGRVDARLEWIHYDLGYSESEWERLKTALTQLSPYLLENLRRFSRPGLEFLTQNFWSASVRFPDLGPSSDWQWTGRVLVATGDAAGREMRSGLLQSSLEIPVLEAGTLYGEVLLNSGTKDTELFLTTETAGYVGARWAW